MNNRDALRKRAILIAGPTASGKSAVALELAWRLGGTVINADSMQVYSDLHILTARPAFDDVRRAPHRLFGHIDGAKAYSVGQWSRDVGRALGEAWEQNSVPILVGGTGLYIKALTQGLSAIPEIPTEIRAKLRAEAEIRTPADLHADLAKRDPLMAARLRPSDPQRILRALEVVEATGQSLLTFQAARTAPLLPMNDITGVFINPERADLNDTIDRRFDWMMKNGALAEVEALAARQLPPDLPAMRALGVLPLLAHLHGTMPLEEAVGRSKLLTRRYAKRQVTFARHQLPGLVWLGATDACRHAESMFVQQDG